MNVNGHTVDALDASIAVMTGFYALLHIGAAAHATWKNEAEGSGWVWMNIVGAVLLTASVRLLDHAIS